MNVASRPLFTTDREDRHGRDFFLRSRGQARLLGERRFDELDLIGPFDAVRASGAPEEREIRNHLAVLPMHLLERRHRADRRSSSWAFTTRDQRDEPAEVISHSPGLRRYPDRVLQKSYRAARLKAAAETGLDFDLFREAPPFTAEQAPDPDFRPADPPSRGDSA